MDGQAPRHFVVPRQLLTGRRFLHMAPRAANEKCPVVGRGRAAIGTSAASPFVQHFANGDYEVIERLAL
jgi:hypothetical protein